MPTEKSSPSEIDDLLLVTRRELVSLCRSSQTRTSVSCQKSLSPWSPQTVTNPKRKQPYTANAAWQEIAAALESGCPIDVISPDGSHRGAEYGICLNPGEHDEIHVRLRIGTRKIIGQSFSYQTLPTDD